MRERKSANQRFSRRRLLGGAAVATGGVLLGGAVDLAGARGANAAEAPRAYTRAEWGARAPSSPVAGTAAVAHPRGGCAAQHPGGSQ